MYITTDLNELQKILPITIKAALDAGEVPQPIILLAAPGAGKTFFCTRKDVPGSLPNLYADALGVDVADVGIVVEKIARRDAADLAGIPLPVEGEDDSMHTEFTVSPVIKSIEATGCEFGILVLDEAAQGNASQQKICADCFDPNEHKLGSFDLPRGWIVVGTGNRAADKAGAMRLLSHLTNRALVASLETNITGWRDDFAIPMGVNPVVVDCAVAHFENGFIADKVPAEDGPYCTLRSLTAAARHLDAYMASAAYTGGGIPKHIEKLLAMNIGQSAAATLCEWIAQSGQVPTAEEIMADPEGALVPDQTGFQQVAAHRAMAAIDSTRAADAALHYIMRLRRDLQVSLGVKLMRLVADKGWVSTDPAYAAFIEQFNQYLPLTWED